MNGSELEVASRVGAAFDRIGVEWLIGGSVASSVLGVPRATNDVDLVAALSPDRARALVDALGEGFYLDIDAVRDAARSGRSFNIIEDETVTKVDVFVARPGSTAARELTRRVWLEVAAPDGGLRLPFASPADIIIEKLAWYERGGRISDRQWHDVIGVLRARTLPIDEVLLDILAEERGLVDLLVRARAAV